MNFNDLSDDVVHEIFSRIKPKKLLATERVSKNWQIMVKDTLDQEVKNLFLKRPDANTAFICKHDYDIRHTMAIEELFDYILEEKQVKIEEAVGRRWNEVDWSEGLRMPRGMQLFTSFLSKLSGLRSIDLAYQEITVKTLVQVFELCPQIECFGFGNNKETTSYSLDEMEWTNFVNRFGHRLVHIYIKNIPNTDRLLLLLAESFSSRNLRLELIAFSCQSEITQDIFTALLQIRTPDAYIWIQCNKINIENKAIDDIFNTIFTEKLIWNVLPDKCQRLYCLYFASLVPQSASANQFKNVNFLGLNELIVAEVTDLIIQVLSGCQFPVLKDLYLRFELQEVIVDVDQQLNQLFQKMPVLKVIRINDISNIQLPVPGPAILAISRLVELEWRVYFQSDWDLQTVLETFDAIKQLPSLEKLKLKYNFWPPLHFWTVEQKDQWQEAIKQRLNALKEEKQINVVVELI